jgi:hypothetical protein
MELQDWQIFFLEQLDKKPFVPSEILPDPSPEVKAYLSKEAYTKHCCYSEAARTLSILSMNYKPKRITEMGTGWGLRTVVLARLNPEAIVYSIELAKEMGGSLPGLIAKHLSNVQFVKGDSKEWDIPDIELCFIDADHSTESVFADSRRAFSNRNVDNWCIVWDDYPLPTVKEGVDRFVAEVGYPLKVKDYAFIGSRDIKWQNNPKEDLK